MLLSKQSIRRRLALPEGHPQRIVLEGVTEKDLQPASCDVYVGDKLQVWTGTVMDGRFPDRLGRWWRDVDLTDDHGAQVWTLQPGRFYLGSVRNRLVLPADVAATVSGNSTGGRQGILIHVTAGHVDPGWDGNLTLEMAVLACTTVLVPGQRIGQLVFQLLDEPSEDLYEGRYQHDTEPQPAKPARLPSAIPDEAAA